MNRTNEQMQMCVDTNYKDYEKYDAIKDVAILLVRYKGMKTAFHMALIMMLSLGGVLAMTVFYTVSSQ